MSQTDAGSVNHDSNRPRFLRSNEIVGYDSCHYQQFDGPIGGNTLVDPHPTFFTYMMLDTMGSVRVAGYLYVFSASRNIMLC